MSKRRNAGARRYVDRAKVAAKKNVQPKARSPELESLGEDAASKSGVAWEPIEEAPSRWGVFDVEGDTPMPVATFMHEQDAREWLSAKQNEDPNEAEPLNEYHAVMAIRQFDDRAFFWNSHDLVPAE